MALLFASCNKDQFYSTTDNSEIIYQNNGFNCLIKKIVYSERVYYVMYQLTNFKLNSGLISFELNMKMASIFIERKKLTPIEIDSIFDTEAKYNLFLNKNYYSGLYDNNAMIIDCNKLSYDSNFDKLIFKKSSKQKVSLPEIIFKSKYPPR